MGRKTEAVVVFSLRLGLYMLNENRVSEKASTMKGQHTNPGYSSIRRLLWGLNIRVFPQKLTILTFCIAFI